MRQFVPFNRPHITGNELSYIQKAHDAGALSGDGKFSRNCETKLRDMTRVAQTLVTHSCTAALEMAALLSGLKPDDEVIMPSYTFVSTANAVVLRGAIPIFIDIRTDTLNIDEALIEAAITDRTRAIWVVHYAGVSCEMDTILAIAKRHNLTVVEDAAQGIEATYKGRPLGGLGDFGAMSFHETKNITCGQGGALFIRDAVNVPRAEIAHQKGTDRRSFVRGTVDKYTWQDVGSSYLLGEMSAAFLAAQLDRVTGITTRRLKLWNSYQSAFEDLENLERLRRPHCPDRCQHNAHMYYFTLSKDINRQGVLQALNAAGVNAVFHYVPLHSSPAGRRFGRTHGTLANTDDLAARIIRLPLFTDMTDEQQDYVIQTLNHVLKKTE